MISPGHIHTHGLPWWLSGKESACNSEATRDVGSIPRSERYPGEGNGHPLQYSCLENPMDRGVWWVAVHRVQRVDRTETLGMQTCIHTHTGTCHTSLSISLLLTFSSLSCFHIVLIVNMLLSTSVFIFLAYVFADLDHNIGHVLVLYFLSSSDLIHLRVYMIVCISVCV